MVATTYHAVRYQASVFEGLVSRAIVGDVDTGFAHGVRSIWTWVRGLVAASTKWAMDLKIRTSRAGWTWATNVNPAEMAERGGRWIRAMVAVKKEEAEEESGSKQDSEDPVLEDSDTNVGWKKWMKALNMMKRAQDWIRSNQVEVECTSKELIFATYQDLIAEASDPTLLDRAVASLSYRDWMQYGGGSADQLQKVYTRLMATDTSFRVQETINAQISRFSAWFSERRKEIEENREDRAERAGSPATEGDENLSEGEFEAKEEEEEEERRVIQLTAFLVKQRKDQISRWFNPTWENCTHILDLLSLPFDEFVAKCLCINNYNINLGDHRRIFFWSVFHCFELLRAHKRSDVTRILSHLEPFSALTSFVLAHIYEPFYDRVLKLIIGDRRTEVLRFLHEFLSTPRDWSNVEPDNASAAFLIAAGSPSHFPSDLNLSPIIAHIARHPSWWNWPKASDRLIAYLGQCDISTLSDLAGIHHFLQQCVHLELPPPPRISYFGTQCATQETRDAARTLLHQYEAFFTSNIPLPPSPPLPTSDEVISSDSRSSIMDLSLLSDSEYLDEASSPLSVHTLDDPGAPEITPLDLDPSESLPSSPSSSTGHHAIDMTDTER
ncbi:hypothetical protein SISSUDRAFT_1132315 [Sistotremastrum suecicum HHB10207 ss-3]|uniref:Uncharacterized protein n=1 Tax=Sistotremastrum suecicum HHB10207 ss-3 TaxID=1314776 RepID=A0A165Z006_9AGAM|nr:hypothetical protein SISSUDRAFT_1132315 [Sistotremastrum suecicum HHB10207 ss-3]